MGDRKDGCSRNQRHPDNHRCASHPLPPTGLYFNHTVLYPFVTDIDRLGTNVLHHDRLASSSFEFRGAKIV